MKVGDVVKHRWGAFTGIGIVIKVHDGRQAAGDIMTPIGIQKHIWVNHVEVLSEAR